MSNQNQPRVNIEFCGVCDYGGHCLALANAIKKAHQVLKYYVRKEDKLQTMALPDYGEVVNVVLDVSNGGKPQVINGQQPIDCAIS